MFPLFFRVSLTLITAVTTDRFCCLHFISDLYVLFTNFGVHCRATRIRYIRIDSFNNYLRNFLICALVFLTYPCSIICIAILEYLLITLYTGKWLSFYYLYKVVQNVPELCLYQIIPLIDLTLMR